MAKKQQKLQTAEERFAAEMMPEQDGKKWSTFIIIAFLSLGVSGWFGTFEFLVDDLAFANVEQLLDAEVKLDDLKEKKKEEEKKKPKDEKIVKKPGTSGQKRGKGNPKAPVTRGVLKIIGAVSKKSGFNASTIMNNTKFAKDLDKVLKNVSGLKKTGSTKLGERRGSRDAGFNEGSAGGGDGIGDMLGGLLGGGGGAISTKAKGRARAPRSRDIDMGDDGAGRSKADIMRVIRRRTPGLRHIYTKHLRKNPGFAGKVALKFTIAPSGAIISIRVAGSTTGVSAFDNAVKNKVRQWKFGVVKSGKTTLTVPFTFSE